MAATFTNDLAVLLDQVNDPMVELRHDLHANPELSFAEYRTTQVVRDRLSALGWELAACPTDTGAVATLKGGRRGRRVMVRADIDGLPVHEESTVSFRSRHDGVMHACGHDVHTASLLGVADLLARRRDDLAGEFTLVFQPAEESLGGAKAMIAGGLLRDHPVDYVIGAHVTSLAPVGFVGTRGGIIMSEASAINVRIAGKGGHGAMAATDGNVVLAVSALAPRLSEVVTGLSYEGTDCACSAGVLAAGTANNVVPRYALLRGTLRTFTPDQRRTAIARLSSLLREIDDTFGVTSVLELGENTLAVTNDDEVAARVLASASAVVGPANAVAFTPVSPSDDVSEFLSRVPGCYMFVGGALADGTSGMHHSPDFAVADESCRVFAGVLAASAVDLAQS
ncbi:MAG TPA: M20 family metallopeptidase [Acidimicrobiales bacterium]|nr:M20 family metallopeptidase [Acidimicrobiales bacterium]